jgi:hypothetical protein
VVNIKFHTALFGGITYKERLYFFYYPSFVFTSWWYLPYFFLIFCIFICTHISYSDVLKSLKHLRLSKSVGLDNIPGLVINGCSDIFSSVLKHIFHLSLSKKYFLILWNDVTIIPVFKQNNGTSVSNNWPASIPNFTHINSISVYDDVPH